jgi:hypothetical protein
MQVNRRQFLKGLRTVIAGTGLSNGLAAGWGWQTAQVLAEAAPQKLALLVGINQYQDRAKFPPLRGCLTDVELQRIVLTHRFGFLPENILVLQDKLATRNAIESAFQSHLVDRARPGDVVVFHFSGYGRSVLSESRGSDTPSAQIALMPTDIVVPGPEGGDRFIFNGILADTLYLLLKSLRTERVVTVLDAGFTLPTDPLQLAVRSRALPPALLADLAVTEYSVQERLRNQTKVTRAQLAAQRELPPPNGLWVGGSQPQIQGCEADWSDFSAGVLTYAFTQTLWHTTATTSVPRQLARTTITMAQVLGAVQAPKVLGHKQAALSHDLYGLPSQADTDGVILDVDPTGKTAHIWLGGLPTGLLHSDHAALVLRVWPANPPPTDGGALVQIISRRGLNGTGRWLAGPPLAAGQRVIEVARILDRTQSLKLTLSGTLDRIEKVDATSAFSALSDLVSIVPHDQMVDYSFTKVAVTPTIAVGRSEAISEVSTDAGETEDESGPKAVYGLCTLGGDRLPDTVDDPAEGIKNRIQRLKPTLATLMMGKWLALTMNGDHSQVPVVARLLRFTKSGTELIATQQTGVAATKATGHSASTAPATELPRLNSGDRLQLELLNTGTEPLYALVLGLDSAPKSVALFNPEVTETEDTPSSCAPWTLEPGQTLALMPDDRHWSVRGSSGFVSLYVICARQPFPTTMLELAKQQRLAGVGSKPELARLSDPLSVVQAILQDIHQARDATLIPAKVSEDSHWLLDLKEWATLPFLCQLSAS